MRGRYLAMAAVLAASLPPAAAAEGNAEPAGVGSAEAAKVGSAEAARAKLSMCIGCHGIPGYRTSFPAVYSVPKLGGQHPAYIVRALEAYKAGERSHPTMQGIARGLSEQDMADLAAYYGGAR